MAEVKISSRADLNNIIKELLKIRKEGKASSEEIRKLGEDINKTLSNTAKNTETNIKKSGSLLRRLANQLYSDFKALASLNALEGALKLSNQFQGSVKETIKLSDAIRKLGNSFGIAKKDFGTFESSLASGLGKIGASSEDAANALKGLAGLGVKGQASVENLTKGAVTLSGIGGEKGNEQAIASMLGKTLQAQGADINDLGAQKRLIGEVTAVVKSTGQSTSQVLSTMEALLQGMDRQLAKKLGPEGLAQLSTIASTVGPEGVAAFKEFFDKSTIERLGQSQQGVGFLDQGGNVDLKKIMSFLEEGKSRIGFDPRKSLETMGFSKEAADGLLKISERSKDVQENLNNLAKATRDNEQAFREGQGLLDSFNGTINTLKGAVMSKIGGLTQAVTDAISSQVGDTAGSGAVVAGGGLLAAVLAGGGLRGIGSALGGGLKGIAQEKAYESITGENVVPVKVINFSDMPGSATSALGGVLDKAKGLGTMVGKGGLVGAAALGGYELGGLINQALDKYTQGKSDDGYEGNAVERLFNLMSKAYSRGGSREERMKIEIDSKVPNIMGKPVVGRGASH